MPREENGPRAAVLRRGHRWRSKTSLPPGVDDVQLQRVTMAKHHGGGNLWMVVADGESPGDRVEAVEDNLAFVSAWTEEELGRQYSMLVMMKSAS